MRTSIASLNTAARPAQTTAGVVDENGTMCMQSPAYHDFGLILMVIEDETRPASLGHFLTSNRTISKPALILTIVIDAH